MACSNEKQKPFEGCESAGRLFNIPASSVTHTVHLSSYKYNKIFNKIKDQIKKDHTLILEEQPSKNKDNHAYTVTGDFEGSLEEFLEEVRQKIAKIMRSFPDNYSFDLRGHTLAFGYTYSFLLATMDKSKKIGVFHKITEKRTDGTTKPPQQVIWL